MRKTFFRVLGLVLCAALLTGCNKKPDNTEELKKYKQEMTEFFTSLEKINTNINNINPEDQESMDNLYTQFAALDKAYKELADIEVPEDFINNETLADQASEYMTQANEYLRQAFTETSYNQTVLDAAMECYKRANKRLQYIITILHGELPQGEDVQYN